MAVAGDVRVEEFAIQLGRLQSWKRAGGQSTIVLLASKGDDAALQWLAASFGRTIARSGIRAGDMPPRPHRMVAYDPVEIPPVTRASPVVTAAASVHLVRNRRGEGRLEERARYRLGQ